MAVFMTPQTPSVKAVSRPPAFPTNKAMLFLTPNPRVFSVVTVGTTTAGDTDARIDPK